MRTYPTMIVCLALASSLHSAEPQKSLGTWKLLAVVADGKEIPIAPSTLMEVTADGWAVTVAGQVYEKGTSKATGGDKNPSESEYTPNEGPRAGKTFAQITKIEGDILISCAADAGQPRPGEFISKPGSGQVLSVWLRVK
jgi:uncharacterized protein (TIGR03067 family)